MAQIALPLSWAEDRAAERFLVTPSNAAAARLVDGWRDWPVRVALLAGPPRSGRTLLANLFRAASGGEVIDDADTQPEEQLFHAWNKAQGSGLPLLMVAAAIPPVWSVALPDLRTRLAASPAAEIAAPDDALMRLLVEEVFAQHRTVAREDLFAWLATRVERSHAALLDAAERVAVAAAAAHRRPSVSLARHVLGL